MRRQSFSAGIVCVVGFVLALPAAFAQKKPMTLVDLLEIPSLRNPRVSPDGRQVVFALYQSDWKLNKQVSHLWRADMTSGERFQLTNGYQGETSPVWSPDGNWIAFLAKRDPAEHNQIYVIRNDGGEGIQLTHHATAVSRISWPADGEYLYFLARDPKSKEEKQKERSKDDVFAFDENYQQQHLWRIPFESKKEERVTRGDFSIRAYELSADGNKVVVQRAPSPLYDDSDEGEVWIMNADGSSPRQLTHNHVAESDARLSPNGTQVAFLAGANAQFDTYYNSNLFLVPAAGGNAVPPFPDFPYDIADIRWSHDGKTLLAVASMGVHSEVLRLDPVGKTFAPVTDGQHALRGWDYNAARGLSVFSVDSPVNPGDVWSLSGKKSLHQVTHVFDYLQQRFLLPRQEKIEWKGKDGVTLEGLLFYPLNYQAGKRYPLAVQTHGGPASADHFGFAGDWAHYDPVLAAQGYAVLRPNYRGSTGYGNDFLRDMVGHYYKNAHLDVMAGVDHVIAMGVADPDRMVKMGWSAGGHMTDKIITFTDRFKAASSGAGAVDWIGMYAQSDVRIYRTPWFGGTPWQKDAPIDVYWNNSPLKDIWKVKTPTLVFVGERDVRVPSPQSVELYRALKSNGVPTHLYIAPREPHGWRELRHRLFKMNRELAWFARWALNSKYTWEKPPEQPKEGTDSSREPR